MAFAEHSQSVASVGNQPKGLGRKGCHFVSIPGSVGGGKIKPEVSARRSHAPDSGKTTCALVGWTFRAHGAQLR